MAKKYFTLSPRMSGHISFWNKDKLKMLLEDIVVYDQGKLCLLEEYLELKKDSKREFMIVIWYLILHLIRILNGKTRRVTISKSILENLGIDITTTKDFAILRALH